MIQPIDLSLSSLSPATLLKDIADDRLDELGLMDIEEYLENYS